MVREFHGHVFVDGIFRCQLDGDLQHVLAEQRDPSGPVGLLQVAASGQRRAAVEDADIVQSEETSFKEVLAESIFAIYPPAEVQRQLSEGPLEKIYVPLTMES